MSISPNAQYRAVETGHIRVAGEFPFYHFRISFSFDFRFLFSPNAMNVILRNIQRHEKKAFCALSAAVSPPRYLKIPCATISEGRGSDKESLRTGRSASVNLPTAGRHFFHSPPRIVKSYFQPQPSCGVILSPKR